MEIDLPDPAATDALGRRLGLAAWEGDVVALAGPLGAGKTALARGFVQALAGAGEEVPSPTFTLVQTYETGRGPLWHVDLYRIATPDEVWELGLEEAFGRAILVIEWPERLGVLLPAMRTEVALTLAGAGRRVRLGSVGGARLLDRAGLA